MEDNHLDVVNNSATSQAMRKAIANAVADAAFNRYPGPGGACAQRRNCARSWASRLSMACCIGSGSDEVIAMVSQAVLAGGGTVLLEPSFAVFRNAAVACAGRYVGRIANAD